MLMTERAVLVHLKPVGIVSLVLLRVIVSLLAFAAHECDLNSVIVFHFGTSYMNF